MFFAPFMLYGLYGTKFHLSRFAPPLLVSGLSDLPLLFIGGKLAGWMLSFIHLYDFGFLGRPPFRPLMRACSFPASVVGPVEHPPCHLHRPPL